MNGKTKFHSSLGFKYPTLRDTPLHLGLQWLEGKRIDDGAEDFWRIHDNLYDMSDFIKLHPGGADWIKLTKGTDITEAFETHHLSDEPEKLLPRYFVGKAKTPRNSPFTFHRNGFYKTLRSKIIQELPKVPKGASERTKTLTDLLVVSYIVLVILAAYFRSFACGLLAGIVLSLTAIAAHNYFHRRNSFRMYYFDLTLMQSKSWRVSHSMSHHMFTNTIYDLEISAAEPFLEYLPGKGKNKLLCYARMVISPFYYVFAFFGEFMKNAIEEVFMDGEYSFALFLPFSIVLPMLVVTRGDVLFSVIMFVFIQMAGGFHFVVVGLNAAHHHPDIFHDGDTSRPMEERDWGIHQLDAVMDRKEITGSHFLVLTHFGDHALHHLFPTLDHGVLEHLYPTFLKTCEAFGIDWRMTSFMDLTKGQFRQIVKIEPKKEPPKPLKTIILERCNVDEVGFR